jgi:formylglycine-generating enzyme required for sulfatase activity/outer membrane protein assembly factor BamB
MLRTTALLLAFAIPVLPVSGQENSKDSILKRFHGEFVLLTPGKDKFPESFVMGEAGKPGVSLKVTFKHPFAMAKYEVTQELYEALMDKNPSRWKGPRNSVEKISWHEAVEFCRKATAELRRMKLIGADEVIRLPSEAEWEYACRAGTTTKYSFGDADADLGAYAWFTGNAKGNDPPVGAKKPNPWGLYDMHGYVWEWCADSWRGDLANTPTDGRPFRAETKVWVIRGGSWKDKADACASASRRGVAADTLDDGIGFRCVKAKAATPQQSPAPQAGQADADWPQFLGPQRNGVSTEKGLALTWDAKGPPVLWQRNVGSGYSGAVVQDGRLILFHRVGDEEIVEAVSARAGAPLWKFAYPTAFDDSFGKGNGPRATPVIAGDRVYTLGAEGMLHCLELTTGKKIWDRALHREYKLPRNFFGIGTTPLLAGDLLLVNVGAKDAGIVAFECATGKEKWRATQDEASYASPVLATLDGKQRAVFLTRAGVVILDPQNGTVLHQQPWKARYAASVNAATPLVAGDLLFFSASYETGALLLRYQRDKAEKVWSQDNVMSNHYNTCVLHDGFLYGFDGRQEAVPRLRCVELKTGKVRWTKEDYGCGSMVLVDGRVIVLTEKGELVCFAATPEEYREQARARVFDAPPCRAQLALAHGVLYARDDGKLRAFNLRK